MKEISHAENNENEEMSLAVASKKWDEMQFEQRQYWLAKLADKLRLNPREQFMLIMKNKTRKFDEIDDAYKNMLIDEWISTQE